MSKRILWILTIALSLTLVGLSYIQISWIRNAVDLKDKQFQQLVNNTLSDIARQVEHFYTSRRMNTIIEEQLSDDSELEWKIQMEAEDPGVILDEENDQEIGARGDAGMRKEEVVEILGDSLIVITHLSDGRIDTINLAGYHELLNKRKLEKSLEEQQVLVTTIMRKMLLEDVSFEERLDQKQLERIISKNFRDKGINLDYEYSVIRDDIKQVYTSDDFVRFADYYYYRTGLLNGEILKNNTYLYLYFPEQKALVRGSLGFLATSTMILTFLMIILFTMALYVIFRQKKLSEIKNDFVNNMTHELKTPISTISLASQMLSDTSIPVEKKNLGHISRIVQTESKRLGYQVERVLQMAVLDQGHLVLKRGIVEMREVLSAVIQNFRLQVENQQGNLEFIDESENDRVEGDRVHLMNVITNLIDNAIKYSRGKPVIKVKIDNSGSDLRLMVRDAGIGISKENQKKIFDRFYRVSTGNVHDVKGFGLGLSYVKLIVEQHGGSIRVSSELNKGTEFVILLPNISENQAQ